MWNWGEADGMLRERGQGHGGDGEEGEERVEDWKVMIHDLSGSAVAAAFMATPFVPAPGGDTVARSNPGAWLIVRADTTGCSDSWHPWGRLQAWLESSSRDTVRLRLHLLPDGQDDCVLVSETPLSSEKGREFSIDMDRETSPVMERGEPGRGVCRRVEGEARSSRPLVQLAMRHVTCMEDAAMFVALAAAVDLSVKACRPFPRKPKKKTCSPSPDPLELDTIAKADLGRRRGRSDGRVIAGDVARCGGPSPLDAVTGLVDSLTLPLLATCPDGALKSSTAAPPM
ncbi:hypothetical protein HU200_013266 [Digitaria exilis]|uniref:Uncharacterized protein n=1 Tax=Digitaria exilis TaxID=1010633 RepID=A0A835FE09_9POAL|nr:hypothetical protein HU200_013266 [Digitaria exilis]